MTTSLVRKIFPIYNDSHKIVNNMKAKISLSIFISLLFCMTDINAQTRFYDVPRTFNEQGFTYVSRLMVDFVRLHNKENRWIGVMHKNRDGTPTGFPTDPVIQIDNDRQMSQLARSIVHNAFTAAERQRLRGSRLFVSMYVDSQTGVVDDVEFVFWVTGGFATIPVSTYRRIELELKNRIRFIPTAEGRRRNYIFVSIVYEVE